MNPLTLVRRTQNINAKEAELGISDEASWHANYKDSAYVFVGGIPYDLTEGDLLAVFSQYGEIVDVNLVREKSTGKSKGFAFIAYEDQRSTTLAVDNLNGAQLAGRTIRVDHVSNYKKKEEEDEETERQKREERGVCRAFQKGECKYGDSCKFSHDEQRAANTGWGPEEERKAKSAQNKLDNLSGVNKRSREPPPSHASNRSSSGNKMIEDRKQYEARSGDQNTSDRPKRVEHREDRDKRHAERRPSLYEPDSKKSRDSNGREEKKKSFGRDVRDEERDRDRSKDRGRDRDKDTRFREIDGERPSSRTMDHSSQRRRDSEIHREKPSSQTTDDPSQRRRDSEIDRDKPSSRTTDHSSQRRRDSEIDREKPSSRTANHSSQRRKDSEVDDHHQARRDDHYHKSRR